MQAIIPLAGKGTRVRPHTHTRPKPLLRVVNRPVLSYVIQQLQSVGVDEVIAITGHLAPQIETYLAEEFADLPVKFVEQVTQRGTADAIALAEPFVDGPILIVFVDTLFEADFSLIEEHADAAGIIWAKEVEDYQRYGVVVTDDDGYMTRIIEKPSEPISKLANIGVYYIRDHELMFEGVRHVMASDPNLGEYFLTDAFQYMIDHGARLFTAEVGGWFDCGKPETLLETNLAMLERGHGGVAADLPQDVELNGPVAIAADASVSASRIGPNVSIASDATVTRASLRDCIVGEGARIEDCDLSDSLIGDHTSVSRVRGAVNIGDHSEVQGHNGG